MKPLSSYKAPYMLLSVFLAFLFWLYVIDVEDPDQSYTYRDVATVISGENILESQGLTIASLSHDTVDLTIQAPISTLNQLSRDNLSVTVDVSKLSAAGEFLVSYTPVVPSHINTSNLMFEGRNPLQITVEVGKLHTKILPIELDMRGSIAEGYLAGQHTISPESVTLSGSLEALAQVDRAVVIIEQENLSQRLLEEFPLLLMDAQGEILEDPTIECSETSAVVTLPIVVEREIPLVVNLIPGGGATEDHIASLQISPASIMVSGSEEDMAGLEEISLGSIDLSKVLDQRVFTLPISLDPSLKNITGTTEATVTLTIQGLEIQTFEVSNINTANVPPGYSAAITTQMLPVMVRGSREDLDQIDPTQIRVVADLAESSTVGSTSVPATLYLDAPGNAGIAGEYTVVVNITAGLQSTG